MHDISWLDKLKLRYSYGLIGHDGTNQRWLYESQWAYSGQAPLAENMNLKSPYVIYKEAVVGNPDIHWEKARKSNLDLELAVLKNILSTNIEYFTEDRTDILLYGTNRVLPGYYGINPPAANVERVTKNGYEVELKFNENLNKNMHVWLTASLTHVKDKILYKEEPELKDAYLKAQGFPIDQTKTLITDGFYNTWDEVYASTPLVLNDQNKLPGSYNILDFDGDGKIDESKDVAP